MIAPLNSRKIAPPMQALLALLATLLLFTVQTVFAQLSIRIADMANYRAIDPLAAFAWISVHHVAQGLLTLLVMAALHLLFGLDFKLGLGDKRLGLRLVLIVTLGLMVYQLIIAVLFNALGVYKVFPYPINATNVLGTLGFQLLLSGTSEELLFRALPIVILSLATDKAFVLFRGKIVLPVAVLISAVLFSVAHINWSLHPFFIRHMDVPQLLYTLALGILQGWVYFKTGSVVYAMMIHGISNVLVVGYSIVLPMLFG